MAMLVYEGSQSQIDGEATIGRHRENAVVLRTAGASRKHARVFSAEGGWWLEDLGSANGTRHNGRKIEGRTRLANGDAISVGEAEVTFHCSERESTQAVRLDPQSLEGREISGYRLIKLLGRGGMGFLYRAHQVSLDRDVAFKAFARRVVEDDPTFAERFRQLASKSGSLTHDSFAQLHENGCTEGLVWYSMDLVTGDTLESLLVREKRFAPELALLVCERVASAMAEAHGAGIIHRGLNPHSVMLTAEGKVKVLDLGIAAMLGRGRDRTRPDAAWHVAPEVIGGAEAHASDDTYSLGCILYHLIAGVPPYTGGTADEVVRAHREQMIPSLRKAAPLLPAAADTLLESLLTKNRDWRHADMAETATTLRTLRDGLGQAASTAQVEAERMVARAAASAVKKESHVLLNVTVAAVAALVIALVIMFASRELPKPPELPPPPPPVKPMAPRAIPPTGTLAAGQTVEQAKAEAEARAKANDPFVQRLAALRQRVRSAGGEAGWEAVEDEVAQTVTEAEAAKSPTARELRFMLDQLRADAEDWYRARLAALPVGMTPAEAATRLAGLNRLRDQVGPANRTDADARYQQELAILVQRLNEAKRDARRAIESGRPADLPAIAAAITPAFAGSPYEALSRQFSLLCSEATRLSTSWNTDWRTTASAFDRVRGERALFAAAALLVVGDHIRAKRVLLADQQLASGAFLSRRQALLGGLAAVLSFDDPTDLQYIDVLSGDATLAGGALGGRTASGLACTVPIGGADWQAELEMTLAGSGGEAVVTCLKDGEPSLLLRIAEGAVVVRVGGQERRLPLTVAGTHKLRFSAYRGELLVMLAGRTLALPGKANVVQGSQIKLEFAGTDWRLESLQVVGGH